MGKENPKYHQIIDAAVQVIAENGFHASQVSKIAKKANVADGTIYLYFKNKEDILISVFKEKMGSFIDRTTEAINQKETFVDKMKTLIEMHYLQLEESPYLAIVSQLELRQSKQELRREINSIFKLYLDLIDEIVKLGIKEDVVRKDVNPNSIRHMIFGTLDETVTTWVMNSQKYSLSEQTDEIHRLLIGGFCKF